MMQIKKMSILYIIASLIVVIAIIAGSVILYVGYKESQYKFQDNVMSITPAPILKNISIPTTITFSPNPHKELAVDDLISSTPDSDGDGIKNIQDNCVFVPNPDQKDSNANGVGDVCENLSQQSSVDPALNRKALEFLKAHPSIYDKVYSIGNTAMQLYKQIPEGYALNYKWYTENPAYQETDSTGNQIISWTGLPGCGTTAMPNCYSKLKINVIFSASGNPFRIKIYDVGGIP